MKYLLDTDHISILQRKRSPEYARLAARIAACSGSDFALSIVSFHEQAGGCHAYVNRAKTTADVIRGYTMFGDLLSDFATALVLPFDAATGSQFDHLKSMRLGVATMDLRLAAIALSQSLIVLTRNRRDFAKVPGLVIEDWTV